MMKMFLRRAPMMRSAAPGTRTRSLSSGKNEEVAKATNTSVYIHPLSQVVLQYFQRECHHWIVSKNFDQGLTIHRDGTFVLQAPPTAPQTKSPRIWSYYDPMDKKHWLSFSMTDSSNDEEVDESNEKSVQHRFLLQDNLMPAWHGNRRKNLSERVQESVLELMEIVDQDMARNGTKNVQNHQHRRD